jgi:hypothetical protein
MDWDQIESKWEAMARRVRGAVLVDKADTTGQLPRILATAGARGSMGPEASSAEMPGQNDAMLAQ